MVHEKDKLQSVVKLLIVLMKTKKIGLSFFLFHGGHRLLLARLGDRHCVNKN